jgi:peptidoglycan/xylan/chitin deacetylase (PgdA/CDA1 family)
MPGATIGCHGAEHQSLTSLSITEATNDLLTSKLGVEAAVQHTIDTMSYPYGHVNEAVRAAAQQVGFTQAACSTWGFNTQDTDHMMLKRIDMWAGDCNPPKLSLPTMSAPTTPCNLPRTTQLLP